MSSRTHAASLLLLTCLVACGSSGDAPNADPPVVLDGVYQPTSAGAPFARVEFHDGHYRLRDAACACDEEGTFRLDRANHQLHLVADATGEDHVVSFDILTTAPAAGLTTTAFIEPGPSLVQGGGSLIVSSANLSGYGYQLLGDIQNGKF